jgi:hypothetical protein
MLILRLVNVFTALFAAVMAVHAQAGQQQTT